MFTLFIALFPNTNVSSVIHKLQSTVHAHTHTHTRAHTNKIFLYFLYFINIYYFLYIHIQGVWRLMEEFL